MNLLKYCYGLDSFERHRAMAAVIRDTLPPPATLLDVGGEISLRCTHLGRFLQGYEIKTLNIARASDVSYEGRRLPFDDNAVELVVSLDTAEHVARADRPAWIAEFFRVAAKAVVLCAPLGSDYQSRVDYDLNEHHKLLFGREHHYLREHIASTMPDIDEITSWVAGREYNLCFDGDARIYERHTRASFDLQHTVGPLKTPLKLLHLLATLKDLQPLKLQASPTEFSRRWYLSIKL